MKITLKARLARWLKNNPGWHASGAIQRLVATKTSYTPRTTCRRLEELQNEGVLEVEYRHGHAWYRFKHQITSNEHLGGNNETLESLLQEGEKYFARL